MGGEHPDMHMLEEMGGHAIPEAEENAIFGVGISLRPGSLDVAALFPVGCSAEQSGSVAVGDEVVSVDGHDSLSGDRARRLMKGRVGTYATIGFKRYQGDSVRQFKVELIRGPPEHVALLSLCSKLERQAEQAMLQSSRMRELSPAPPPPPSVARLERELEEYKDRLALAEDEIVELKRNEMAIAAMQEKLTGTEEELRQSEGQRRRLQQELATIQEMVNSGTFFRERIADLESQLAVTKLQADDDRRSLREQVSQKEGAILRQVQRISELEKDAMGGASLHSALNDIANLKAVIASKDSYIRSLEMKVGPLRGGTGNVSYSLPNVTSVPTHTAVMSSTVMTAMHIPTSPTTLTTIQQPQMSMTLTHRGTTDFTDPTPAQFTNGSPTAPVPVTQFTGATSGGVQSYSLVRNSPNSHSIPSSPISTFWGADVPTASPFASAAASPYLRAMPQGQVLVRF